jgi:cellulose synthase/poly-beta-1,6-N-acetylglucosamine synthase-like glycosyltransferase
MNTFQVVATFLSVISGVLLLIALLQTLYLFVLALASTRSHSVQPSQNPQNRFAIVIPAHNEDTVIANTVRRLRELDYPSDLFDVHIVADHCTDNTVQFAHEEGAIVHARSDGPRSGKGAALSWLIARILDVPQDTTRPYSAVVIFDADTRVAPDFLRMMDARLAQGDLVVQGQHRISNPQDGLFPALTHAMFLIDNRFQNQGRTNLGLSAKIMGDSICFHADILRKLGWGEGLTEDYQLRLRLLLKGMHVVYEPAAIGNGEAAQTWKQARAQRARWLTGTHNASQEFAQPLLRQGLHLRNWAMLDGALQTRSLSFSTLALLCMAWLIIQLLTNGIAAQFNASAPVFNTFIEGLWAVITVLLFIYPIFGLALEKAPLSAYLAIMSAGPFYIFWRTRLALASRLSKKPIHWVRTEHGKKREENQTQPSVLQMLFSKHKPSSE